RRRTAGEEIVDEVENVGRVDGAVAVRVARHHAGLSLRRRTAAEEIVDEVEDVGGIDGVVVVRIELLREIGEAAGARGREVVGIRDDDVDGAGGVRGRRRGDRGRVDAKEV